MMHFISLLKFPTHICFVQLQIKQNESFPLKRVKTHSRKIKMWFSNCCRHYNKNQEAWKALVLELFVLIINDGDVMMTWGWFFLRWVILQDLKKAGKVASTMTISKSVMKIKEAG